MVVMPAMMPHVTDALPTDVCAVVLAAGEGRRLRPLTLVRPKPLCPVANVPLVDLAVGRARTATAAVAVNAHHGRDAIEQHLAAGAGGPLGPVLLSVEEDEALGTAGALGLLRPWIDGRGVLVLNSDTWAPGDLRAVTAGWDHERVRLLVAGEDGLWPPERPASMLAGALMPWSEVSRLEAVPSGLWEASWRAQQAAGRLDVVRWDGPCLDCGTPSRYLAANLAASGGAAVVGDGAEVEGALERAVVWAGGRVRRGEHLVDGVRTDDGLTVLVR
jgi:mannose-1-phosphate guanylyltransferase/MurNAc alpha-1-phosphate uridylyltransferase